MSSNPFKNFVAFLVNDEALQWLQKFGEEGSSEEEQQELQAEIGAGAVADPTGSAWSSAGPVAPDPSEPNTFVKAAGEHRVMAIRFNERVLPGNVIKERLNKMIAAHTERDGRKPNKKVIAELKDEVVQELLPKSHIRRTTIPVMFVAPNLMLVFSTSAKRTDDVTRQLVRIPDVMLSAPPLTIRPILCVKSITATLTQIVSMGYTRDDMLEANNCGTFVGEGKRTVKVKDRDLGSTEVQTLFKQDYHATELGLNFWPEEMSTDADPMLTFRLNDKQHFKGVTFPNIGIAAAQEQYATDDSKFDFSTTCYLVAQTYRKLVNAVITELGGLAEEEEL